MQGTEDSQIILTVVGLGPGDFSLLTLGAYQYIQDAGTIFFRTLVHPTVEPLRARLAPSQIVHSFDEQYERATSFEMLYAEISSALLNAAREASGSIVYAVPGHPLVAEQTVTRLLVEGPSQGVSIKIVDGLSFLEPLLQLLEVDPLNPALQILDGAALLSFTPESGAAAQPERWEYPSPRVTQTGAPLILGQVYNRRVATGCKLWLLERYPVDHLVSVISSAGTPDARIRKVSLSELDHSAAFDHLTSLYVQPVQRLQDLRAIETLPYLVARLRAPGGCPWDQEQTWQSLKPHLLEEAFEAVAAIDTEAIDEVAEELGDLLLLVTMLAGIGEEAGLLDLPTVLEAVNTKLVRRHPHVFGDLRLSTPAEVTRNWERIKATEHIGRRSVLDGVPAGMPALIASQVMQRKAAAVGFDWPDTHGVRAKVLEELDELEHAETSADQLEEMGDALFAMVSLCRHLSIDAEEALRLANAKFRKRMAAVEDIAATGGHSLDRLDPTALDALWQQAKAAERA